MVASGVAVLIVTETAPVNVPVAGSAGFVVNVGVATCSFDASMLPELEELLLLLLLLEEELLEEELLVVLPLVELVEPELDEEVLVPFGGFVSSSSPPQAMPRAAPPTISATRLAPRKLSFILMPIIVLPLHATAWSITAPLGQRDIYSVTMSRQ
jgi:hypothetical protein